MLLIVVLCLVKGRIRVVEAHMLIPPAKVKGHGSNATIWEEINGGHNAPKGKPREDGPLETNLETLQKLKAVSEGVTRGKLRNGLEEGKCRGEGGQNLFSMRVLLVRFCPPVLFVPPLPRHSLVNLQTTQIAIVPGTTPALCSAQLPLS